MIKRITLIAILIITLCIQSGWAESVFSFYGMGETIYPVDTRSRAMGGVGIADHHHFNLSSINPAIPISQTNVTMNFSYMPESRKVLNQDNDINLTDTNFPLLKLVIPTFYGVRVSLGASQIIDSDYSISEEKTIPNTDELYIEKIQGNGALYKSSLGVSRKVMDRLSLGVEFSYYFGTKEDAWIKDFEDGKYIDTEDKIENSILGTGFGIGALIQPMENLHLGVVYNPMPSLDVDKTSTHVYDITTTENVDIELPASYGIGLSYNVNEKFRVASDLFINNWEDFSVNNAQMEDFINTTRIGIGMEYVSNANSNRSYWQRVPLRVGFYRQNWYYELNGESITENFVTAGFGLPLGDRGMLDMGFELGMRGNEETHGIEEQVFRFSLSLSGYEKWGKPRRY